MSNKDERPGLIPRINRLSESFIVGKWKDFSDTLYVLRRRLSWVRRLLAFPIIPITLLLPTTLESYPNVMIRAFGIVRGRKSRSHNFPVES